MRTRLLTEAHEEKTARTRGPVPKRMARMAGGLLLGLAVAALHACSGAPMPDEAGDEAGSETAPQSAAGIPNPLRNAYFGDLHVHTSWSLDAYTFGHPMNNDPSVAYRYGRGDPITGPDGNVREQLRVPLDFMAATDHDNFLGEVQLCQDQADAAYNTPICEEIRSGGGFTEVYQTANVSRRDPDICDSAEPGPENKCDQRASHQWQRVQEMADAYYEPGRFTTFTAFEFTASDRATGGWLHRNVFFRGEQIPEWGGASILLEHSPERLWEWLDAACTGACQVLAIPHNTNFGMGVVLAPRNSDGTPFTEDVLRRRARLEPVIEMHQVKGNSECSTGLLSTDEECNFELLFEPCEPGRDLAASSQPAPNCAHPSNFARNALKTGLAVEAEHGINPFKYGLIGSTDDHRSASGSADEATWPGHFFGEIGETVAAGPRNNPGGLAAVWAEENTREAIFDALRRRETFATSGPRIRVRFFAGWDFPADLHASPTLLETAYRDGVPMGADLPAVPAAGAAPRFVVWAMRDAAGANLQKIQVVKGWADAAGETHEQVYDAVCADGLEPDPGTGRCADNGAQVNLADCSYSANLGAAELSGVWTDPEFDTSRRAFYYVRVLENPTCRWTTWRALETGAELPDDVPPVIKERAWSSPIWYTPEGN